MPDELRDTLRGRLQAAVARLGRGIARGGGGRFLWGLAVFMMATAASEAAEISLAERIEALRAAYPGEITDVGSTHLTMRDGSRIEIDDGRQKTFEEMLTGADIEDMLAQVYPMDGCASDGSAPADFDPGRVRNEAFFRSVYGTSKRAVADHLVPAAWFGQEIKISSRFGLPERFEAVTRALAPKLESYRDFLIPSAGAFLWRTIAGTERLSTHSFGIAIDLSTKKTEYWRWAAAKPGGVGAVRTKVPDEIVAAFERQGFIWGGKWHHYDTMHFEYRPELIAIGQLAKQRGCVR